MANTYKLISSTVLSSSAATVAFNSIPNTYTDLVFKVSARSGASNSGVYDTGYLYNGADFSNTQILSDGSAATSTRTTGTQATGGAIYTPNANADSNVFSSNEIYWPNYNSSINQQIGIFTVTPNTTTSSSVVASALLWQSTSALTGVTLFCGNGSFVAGSSFYLYGIKNS